MSRPCQDRDGVVRPVDARIGDAARRAGDAGGRSLYRARLLARGLSRGGISAAREAQRRQARHRQSRADAARPNRRSRVARSDRRYDGRGGRGELDAGETPAFREDRMRLENKVALITGAASGMGASMARIFAREGAKVVVADMLDEEGKKVAAEITQANGAAMYQHLDVTSEAEWQAAIAATLAAYGKLDILVNDAGISGS